MQPERIVTGADVQGFGYSEHLLIWSWRRIATGRLLCPVMAREFQDACGEDGPEVLFTFCTFLKALGFASRRRLTIGSPGCLMVTADERQVLTLIAAAQAQTPALFEAHLRWLTQPGKHATLQIATDALATALKANALYLVLPEPDAPSVCARPSAVA